MSNVDHYRSGECDEDLDKSRYPRPFTLSATSILGAAPSGEVLLRVKFKYFDQFRQTNRRREDPTVRTGIEDHEPTSLFVIRTRE